MVIYNDLPRKEYERIFMCNTAKEIWKTLLITHQDGSIDSAFARFNTIITSLKALDEGYSSKNYIRKFLRALHLKLRAKVTAIEESKDLTSLPLDELIENLKVHEMIIKKDSEIVKAKRERKSFASKAKKEYSDEECLTFGSEDKEYAIAVRDFKNFFKEEEDSCGDPNHLTGECLKSSKDKNQRAFFGGSWSDSGEEDDKKIKDETCLIDQASNEMLRTPSYGSLQSIRHTELRENHFTLVIVDDYARTLQEMSRTMLNDQSLPQKFWCNAIDTSTYILNRILIRAILGKIPYELLRGRKHTLDYFRVIESKCFILNTKDYLTKFDPKSYECVFLGYSQNSKAYIILNKHTRKIKESLNVIFDETLPPSKTSPLVDDDLDEEEAIKVIEKKSLEKDIEDEALKIDKIVNIKESKNHPLENVIGNHKQRTLRLQDQNQSNFFCFISTIEPKNLNESLTNKS
uniref:Retrovirus-related Pol polyprotein from transposon TNT 1-94 n=1 Tax=Tanacetum cinerariifolium TaxID=118510 RepID=A0A6L2JLE0_TANCI|nr:retrovirus-related Pol polyprotein from transposon TNT 1-94 [Tanacetum cinerariifolium]